MSVEELINIILYKDYRYSTDLWAFWWVNVWHRNSKGLLQMLTTKLTTVSQREWGAIIFDQRERVNAVHQIRLLLLF
ncbi:hypothetical protein VDIAB_30442 [Vibrio diabolicus]|nr:hypothetical protein VDIAB_30442 [Vibrio diabolicus]